MTLEEMEAVLLAHEIAELNQDIDATMATVVPDPHYELSALGWIIDGQQAVREMYRRILPVDHRDVAAEKRIHAMCDNTLLREAVMSFNTLEGNRVSGLYLVVLAFDPAHKKISGERMYMDPLFAQMMSEQLGADFGDVPGVSRTADRLPIIAKHDAYDWAAEQGLSIEHESNPDAKRPSQSTV
ncbi:hypothetical protein H7I02_09845 [Mycolicibacterium brumae]|uniref:Nuclear transport factor 2 family protein n=2 Tax=Mycolicibacterium brumae TaxID=85968 RepID=A0A2G5PCB3_9MYCO|nr:hypothetical protein [Mycolicibacterium brumae]PIB75975.1 hypothetical protein CQY22_008020 [Mycolicibacterium brumae]RWA16533.1 hypothetical protein MBRU_07355 [Mycolicibacterium brumae DSM 44177]